MKEFNIVLNDECDVINLVEQCEKEFEEKLDMASKSIVNSGINNILLSGPTCAGKTTTAQKIISDFHEAGKKVTVISIDDFFLDRIEQREVSHDKKIDYDSVDVLDLPLLAECIKNAKPGNIIKVPRFDFITQSRTHYVEHLIEEDEVLIYEGIQAVYPEITALFNGNYKGIFIDVSEDVTVNGVFFKNHEIRLIRRLVRDRKFRGASPDFTFYLWETVRENEKKSIYPNKNICTVNMDTFLPYELFLMRNHLIEVLSEVKKESKYYEKASKLISKIESFGEIDYKYIPKNSLYTEFLGKK